MPLSDGTNDEKEDVSPPLEWKTKDDLKNVTIHQMRASPPCCKIRNYLHYYNVPFKEAKGQVKGSAYKKVPSLLVDGRQINDSFIIIKNLVPVLTGEAFDETWEKKITYEMMEALELEVLGQRSDAAKFMKLFVGLPTCIGCCLAPIALGGLVKKLKAKNLRPSFEVGKEFAEEIGSKKFHGGEKPNQVDLSYYGTLIPFVHAKCSKAQDHLNDSGLTNWHSRMQEIMPKKVL